MGSAVLRSKCSAQQCGPVDRIKCWIPTSKGTVQGNFPSVVRVKTCQVKALDNVLTQASTQDADDTSYSYVYRWKRTTLKLFHAGNDLFHLCEWGRLARLRASQASWAYTPSTLGVCVDLLFAKQQFQKSTETIIDKKMIPSMWFTPDALETLIAEISRKSLSHAGNPL